MKRLIPFALILTLPACVGGLTPRQSMYAAYGTYSAALEGAVAYAESPTASPAVVHRMNEVNQAVKPAVIYGRAFVRCMGSNTTIVAGLNCAGFDFSNRTSSGFASQLRAAATALAH